MRIRLLAVRLGVLMAGAIMGGNAGAQSTPTATQALEISIFGTGTGTHTELGGGRNGAITAGLDLSFREYFHLRPSLEVRGTIPYDNGQVDGQKSVKGGLKLTKDYGRFHPYVDGLFGRGAITYEDGGIIINNFRYDRTTSNIFAGGAGIDIRLLRQFDGKADIQFERWNTPVTDTGVIYPIPLSFGIVYHLDFNGHRHKFKRPKAAPQSQDTTPAPSAAP